MSKYTYLTTLFFFCLVQLNYIRGHEVNSSSVFMFTLIVFMVLSLLVHLVSTVETKKKDD